MYKRPRYSTEIYDKIEKMDRGSVFSAVDFSDIAGVDAINQALSRLKAQGFIRRITQGIYDLPEYSELLKEYGSPRMDKVATALARKYNWTIAPSGNTALNMLHLSTQVPNKWEYISDGPYRAYEIGKTRLEFKKRANKNTSGMSYLTVAVIEAIKAIGKSGVDSATIERLNKTLSDPEKKMILSESKTATTWVYDIIKKICEV